MLAGIKEKIRTVQDFPKEGILFRDITTALKEPETMRNMVLESAAEKNLDELVKEIISGKFASNIYHEAKKIYPLKKVETIKTRVF